eukprot:gene15481-biopygen7931
MGKDWKSPRPSGRPAAAAGKHIWEGTEDAVGLTAAGTLHKQQSAAAAAHVQQLGSCNCSAATAMLQEHRTCSSAAAAQLQRCRCSVAGAALQKRNSNAPAAAALQQQLCNRALQQQRSCSCGAATSTLEPHRTYSVHAFGAALSTPCAT